MIDTTLGPDNPSCFRNNFLERIIKLIMTIDDKIRDEKPQCYVISEAAKISTLSSDNIDKYEYLTDKEILPSDQRRITEQTYLKQVTLFKASLLFLLQAKLLEKIKAIEDQVRKQVETLELLKPGDNQQDCKSIEIIFPTFNERTN